MSSHAADYPLTVLFDGACPLCRLEVAFLRERDEQLDVRRLHWVDISAPGFEASRWGCTHAALMAQIHGVRPDGSVVVGVEVFRVAYRAVGLGWWTRPSGWPVLKPCFDLAYRVFARHRRRLAPPLAALLERLAARRAWQRAQRCHQGGCELGERDPKRRSP